jgi:hypothetical protein
MLNIEEALIKIEEIFAEDAGGRGIGNIKVPGDFQNAIKDLNNSNKIMILTGFVIRAAGVGETDGPLGTLSIAKALEDLGKEVLLVTDKFTWHLLEEGKKVLGVKAKVINVPYENTALFCRDLFEDFAPDHFLSIERPGKAANGSFHSMRGEDLSDIIPSTDVLMLTAIEKGIKCTAVGDGGNELGMGKVKEKIFEFVNHGELIAAEVAADNLILAGVSNWGGHGLAAGLSILNGKNLLHDTDMEKKMLERIVVAGSVDGCTREQVATVDGLSLEKNLSIIEEMTKIVNQYLS